MYISYLTLIICLIYAIESRQRRLMSLNMRTRRDSSLSVLLFEQTDSERLKKAKLRLAEAQGVIPIGASSSSSQVLQSTVVPNLSKVREISWRVAEPSVVYDPDRAAKELLSQPFKWLGRNIQIFVPVTVFVVEVLSDILLQKEEQNRQVRADKLLDIISSQPPALIKAGQALASRSDLLPKQYLDSLQKLQDRCPAYPTSQAIELFEKELGRPFNEVFLLDGIDNNNDYDNLRPVAAASIGQVYKGVLRSNGAKVAIKIQRPNCEEAIAVDLFIMRWYASRVQSLFSLLGRDLDVVSVIDDFGELIYREIDYRAEAVNAQRFAELYASVPDVFVPKIYTDLSTSKVLTMEWVDGARLSDQDRIREMGFESKRFVDILVQCSLRQMLENGFFHADPHAGNLLAMSSGKLCYLDFGMVSYVEASQRYSIIEAVVHMVNRDFNSLCNLYKRMGFIPEDVDADPIVSALEEALPDVLNSAVGDFNFKNVISKLGDVMYKFPFSLPPFYIAIIRCLGVLEGLAIQVDSSSRIISDAYPYIASRLLTDPSEELQSALQQLLFKDGNLRWDRLEELLEEASVTSDYDVTMAADQLIEYLSSEQGQSIRDLLKNQLVSLMDELGSDILQVPVRELLVSSIRDEGSLTERSWNKVWDSFLQSVENNNNNNNETKSSGITLSKVVKIVRKSNGITPEKITSIARKVLKEPLLQDLIAKVLSESSERVAVRTVRRIFN